MSERRQTALGVARSRFVEGLPRKAREVRASLALLAGTPSEERPREELRRRLHALYASAQVFRIEELAGPLKETLVTLDQVRDEQRDVRPEELDQLAALASRLSKLGQAPASSETPSVVGDPAPVLSNTDVGLMSPVESGPRARPRRRSFVQQIVSVLLVDEPIWLTRTREFLSPTRFEVMSTDDPEEALRIARSSSPDIVMVDGGLLRSGGEELIARLREDPLTDFVPVVLMLRPGSPMDPLSVREAGADEAIAKPFSQETLVATIGRVTETLAGPGGAANLGGDLTVEEIADRLAEEVRRGIVESAAQGQGLSVPMGDGTALLSAAWSAIGRVRAHVAERSGGRVRFREGPQRGGPAFVALTGQEEAADDRRPVDLTGRFAIVADDDPAVAWFFSGLLREQGAEVAEAADGVEAIELARQRRPDLIISDILMPRLDGFGLTRALERDPALADVPVILLSWREDFLSRMRQLRSGAGGYLRKEAGTARILGAVADALRPLTRLEGKLRAGGDVRGRLEDVGVATLLSTVARERPDARLVIRDTWCLYEAEVRDHELRDLTQTASDGTFARGERVLKSLVGATTGRYTVADSDGPVRTSVRRPLRQALEEELTDLAARVDAVSGRNLAKAAQVELDEEHVAWVVRSSPEQVERVVSLLRSGRGPRELLTEGELAPQLLQQVLVDLSRQGAVRAVVGEAGEDRIELARAAREHGRHPQLSEHSDEGTLSWLPPPAAGERLRQAAMLKLSEPPSVPSDSLSALAPPRSSLSGGRYAELEPPTEVGGLDEPFETTPLDEEPAPGASTLPDPAPAGALATDEPSLLALSRESGPEIEFEAADEATSREIDEAVAEDPEPDAPASPREPTAPASTEDAAETRPIPASEPPAAEQERIARPARAAQADRSAPPEDAAEAPTRWAAWGLVILACAAIGFLLVRFGAFESGVQEPQPTAVSGPADDPAVHGPASAQGAGAPTEEELTTAEPSAGPDPVAADPPPDEEPLPVAWGRSAPGVGGFPGIAVEADEGLLVLEPEAGGASMRVTLDDRTVTVGDAPVALALPPGVHHLTVERGDHQDFVWFPIRAGHTRFVPPLP